MAERSAALFGYPISSFLLSRKVLLCFFWKWENSWVIFPAVLCWCCPNILVVLPQSPPHTQLHPKWGLTQQRSQVAGTCCHLFPYHVLQDSKTDCIIQIKFGVSAKAVCFLSDIHHFKLQMCLKDSACFSLYRSFVVDWPHFRFFFCGHEKFSIMTQIW